MSVSPGTLAFTDATSWYNVYEYRWYSSETGKEIYDLYLISTNSRADSSGSHFIYVDTSTNVWYDLGNGTPTQVIQNNLNIELYNNNGADLKGVFVKPTTASWISSDTNNEGWSYEGTLTVVGTSLHYSIPATSSSGTYELKADGTTQLSIVHGSTASTGSSPNFDQTKIWTLLSPYGDELDVINLTATAKKKVHCNFW
jgi:hypothetical protein